MQSKLQSTYLRKSRVPVRASLPAFVPSATAGSFAEHLPAYMLSFHGCISAGSLPAEAVSSCMRMYSLTCVRAL